MLHSMSLQKKYFDLIRSGQKTIELRLFDEKRRQIKTGDMIEFESRGEKFTASVIGLILSDTFANLFRIINPKDAGFSSLDELLPIMEEFYTPKKQSEFGVVGIKVQLI